MNLLKILFIQMAVFMVILGGLMNFLENKLPVFIRQTFRYGKFAYQQKSKGIIPVIEVPKSWFRHFYIYSSIISTISLFLVINAYFFNYIPKWIIYLLDFSCGSSRYASVSVFQTCLAIILLTFQCYRRFYETQFVSVFSKNGKINLSHYLVGFIHYTGTFLVILSEAPKFAITKDQTAQFTFKDLTSAHIFATILFLCASWHQYKAAKIFGNMRKNSKGKIISQEHHIPAGALFEYITSPHMFCEIVIYFSLTIVLWGNTTWVCIFFWVLSNQTETALLSHKWYKEKFPNYPKERKILIPFVF